MAGSLAVTVCLGLAALEWRLPFELWHIRKLDAVGAIEREAALQALVALRSERGAAALLKHAAAIEPPPRPAPLPGDSPLQGIVCGTTEAMEARAWSRRCAESIGRFGTAALPALESQLRAGDPRVRQWAAFILGQYGQAASRASAALTHACEDPDAEVRLQAAAALGKVFVSGG